MKRHYTGTSSKNFDAEAAGDRKTASQPGAGGDPSRSKLLTAGYPVGESDSARLGGFLKQCSYCRKQIAINSDVFMYGCGFNSLSLPLRCDYRSNLVSDFFLSFFARLIT